MLKNKMGFAYFSEKDIRSFCDMCYKTNYGDVAYYDCERCPLWDMIDTCKIYSELLAECRENGTDKNLNNLLDRYRDCGEE